MIGDHHNMKLICWGLRKVEKHCIGCSLEYLDWIPSTYVQHSKMIGWSLLTLRVLL